MKIGAQKCRSINEAFLVWKKHAQIPLDMFADNTMRITGLLNLDRIISKHVNLEKKVTFMQLAMRAREQLVRQRDRNIMIKENNSLMKKYRSNAPPSTLLVEPRLKRQILMNLVRERDFRRLKHSISSFFYELRLKALCYREAVKH